MPVLVLPLTTVFVRSFSLASRRAAACFRRLMGRRLRLLVERIAGLQHLLRIGRRRHLLHEREGRAENPRFDKAWPKRDIDWTRDQWI